MAIEIARRLIAGVWRTEAADEGGNGGGLPDWWTVNSTPGAESAAFEPTGDSGVPAQFQVIAGPGSRVDAAEVFAVYSDEGGEIFGVDGVGGIAFNMVTTPYSGRVGFAVDDNSQFFFVGPTQNVGLGTMGITPAGAALVPLEPGDPLPTVSPSSGVAFQCSLVRDVYLTVPVTLTNANGTCAVAVSNDNVTYTELVTLAPGVNGAVVPASLWVPANWFVKLTVVNATLGTGVYY